MFLDNSLFRRHLLAYPDLRSIFDLPKNITSSVDRTVPRTTTALPTAMNPELVRVWTVLSDFCAVVERAVAARQYITTDVLLDVMASTMYNLAGLRYEPGSTDELLRLGLLAISCSVFMHWRTLGRSFAHLATEFRNCLQDLAVMSQLPLELSVWLLVIGAVSVFGVTADDDGWLKPLLRDILRRCEMRSWEEARGFMKSLLWIGLVHDTTGARVFGSVGVI